ncbi:hypothetical protein [Fibrobacter sp.]|uniref:hypothetical protein n=1 Tax=Fibrobacter sp. TaxID=35828 RepID=UPI003866D512
MKKVHLTRFAAMATVALMGSTAAWAGTGVGYSWDNEYGILTLFSTDDYNAITITASDVDNLDKSDYGEGINTIHVQRGAASATYSTLMLPATVNVGESDEIVAAYVPTGYMADEKTMNFSIVEDGKIDANTPYLVKVTGSPDNFTFTKSGGSYTIVATGSNEYSSNLPHSCWTFTGSYAKKTWETAPSNVYGYAAAAGEGYSAGQFVKVGSNVTLLPLRAYLTCTSSGYSNNGLPKSAVEELPDVINVRLLGKSGETLSIGTMNTRTGEIQMQDRYYDLKGRKLNGKPQNKIMYVNKKVIKH